MLERITAKICIASILSATGLGFVMIWYKQTPLVGNLFMSCVLVFLASGSVFSICSTMNTRRDRSGK